MKDVSFSIKLAKIKVILRDIEDKHDTLTFTLKDNGRFGYKYYVRISDGYGWYDQTFSTRNIDGVDYNKLSRILEYGINMLRYD